jgi:hypothetical protein
MDGSIRTEAQTSERIEAQDMVFDKRAAYHSLHAFFDHVYDGKAREPVIDEAVTIANATREGGYPGRAMPRHPRGTVDFRRLFASCSTYRVDPAAFDADRFVARTFDLAHTLHCVLADDVGTKAEPPPLPPTWIMETSPDNFQWGYKISAVPVTPQVIAQADAITAALAARGWSDPGMKGVGRLFRVPGSENGKTAKGPAYAAFRARLVEAHWERVYTLAELAEAFDAPEAKAKPRRAPAAAVDASGPAPDEVLDWLAAEGRVIGQPSAGGWVPIRCPWIDEHTDQAEDGTAYRPLATDAEGHASRAFKCHHGHCAERDTRTFLDWVQAQTEHEAREALAALVRRERQREEAKAIGEGARTRPALATRAPIMSREFMRERLVLLSDGARVLDRLDPRWPLSSEDAKAFYAASRTLVPQFDEDGPKLTAGGKQKVKEVPTLSLWQQDPGRITVHGTTFAPSEGELCNDPQGRACINTFQGFEARVAGDCRLIVEHVEWLFGDRAGEFLDWLAHIEQHPGQLVHRVWLHVSDYQGTGRNLMACFLARVWARHVALCVDIKTMAGDGFNGHLGGKLLAVIDEIREGGNERWAHAEAFKQAVTAAEVRIKPKYGRESIEFNCKRWLIFSNHRDCIPLDEGDRRIEVVINPCRPHDVAYYARLAAAMEDPAVASAFGAFLAERDLRAFQPGAHARFTEDKDDVLRQSRSASVAALADYLDEARHSLFTSSELEGVMQVPSVGGSAGKFKMAVAAAGLMKVGKKRLGGGRRETLYCRRDEYLRWKDATEIAEEELAPKLH